MDGNMLTQARDYAFHTGQGHGSGMIIRHGKVVLSWGNTSKDLTLHPLPNRLVQSL